jgi:hypothetical protein
VLNIRTQIRPTLYAEWDSTRPCGSQCRLRSLGYAATLELGDAGEHGQEEPTRGTFWDVWEVAEDDWHARIRNPQNQARVTSKAI